MEGFDEKMNKSLPNAISMLTVTCMNMAIIVVLVLALMPTNLVGMDRNQARSVADSLSYIFDSDGSYSAFIPDGGLSHYLSYAAKNNPEVRASYYQWIAQLEKSGYAGALPDPMISYGRFIETSSHVSAPRSNDSSCVRLTPGLEPLARKRMLRSRRPTLRSRDSRQTDSGYSIK